MSNILSKSTVPISEIFGPTIQGEGMVIGRKTMFVRTAGCEYSCSWCDSAFTWNGTEKATLMSPEKVIEKLDSFGAGNYSHVTITGGNPALIGRGLNEVIDLLHKKGVSVGVETQGSKYQDWFLKVDDMVISPKPPSSGMVTDYNKLDFIINRISKRSQNLSLKVVVFNDEDYQFAKDVHLRYPHILFYLSVGNTDPYDENIGADQILDDLKRLCSKVIEDADLKDVRVLPQLHTLIWGNERKV
ncbi:7-carboxy-7-deazaguanine synthase QueE [Bacillus subtilis]|uniref:7-carboxy-7-deazaguanine synthase QueE n=1 Tax=Bacillus TaxID=1386 RepID=UPI0002597C5E|nr:MULTISPECIES: 7-carboxy-7-deazaguanine synthase QueE [Bacillus]QQF64483.1 7-carboxy-7-deazaguanine synthase QueE [Bacillus mojavensis]AFI27212.1 Radical SAM superfamily protein [Bacillus sp. JS]MBO3637049.1 7-carboxy-7-deazaguanine synthase QueE [Bacillus subtilis]MCV2517496.1 7-carboxy-7-deazaguanine synthase QueE [Bacillus subtilis]QHJ99349.1 7-carboxy-7-deazaguanine synthase [Bacillus subtilis]